MERNRDGEKQRQRKPKKNWIRGRERQREKDT